MCKELLHILDPEESRVSEDEEILQLVRRILLPLQVEGALSSHEVQTLTDMAGLFEALLVLFPWAIRQILFSSYQEGRLSPDAIADYLELPSIYVQVVMSESWELYYCLTVQER